MRVRLGQTSLVFKVIFITSLILIFAISFNVWWNTSLHGASIEKLTEDKTKIISEFIEENVIRAMEKGRHFDMHRILRTFGTYRNIRRISLFDMDGTIKASTQEDELNKKVKDVATYLENRSFTREEKVRLRDGKIERERVYYFNTPILNRPECFQCHDKEKKIIGVLTVANSLKEMDTMISKIEIHSIILAVIIIGFLSFVLGFLFLKFVNIPIKMLTETMKKVEKGDLSARVNVRGRDEMGSLAQNLNIMIGKLNLAKQEAEQYHQELIQRADRMASIGELASGIAHEIRNPLAGIQGAVQILAEAFPKEDPRTQVSEEIQKQIYKLERLVRVLLNYAKPVPANYLPTDINGLIDKVLSFFVTQRGMPANYRIEKKLVSSLPKTMVDPSSMEQAFLNIILNAQKAMPDGGTFTVSTAAPERKDDGKEVREVQIIFEDTGVGIPVENLRKIFNPFFSTRSDGTGLGLAITKNIVEQHGGRIDVQSRVNVGTKFIITLPAVN
ncbi:MAG TPA: ATP-binding protein [Thermodesulfobacteriota bacterium]|nr:ATP-binding protein [Thermodesulfobacteriota bacterium]